MVKRVLVLAVVAMALMASAAFAKDLEVKKQAGDYTVVVRIDKNPPVVGENGITVEVVDNMGKYVKDAKVAVNYNMPPMPGMGKMSYDITPAPKGNGFSGTLNISMGGPWNIVTKVTVGGKTYSVTQNIDVR